MPTAGGRKYCMTHPSVWHTHQYDTPIIMTHPSVWHTHQYDTPIITTHPSVWHTHQYDTPITIWHTIQIDCNIVILDHWLNCIVGLLPSLLAPVYFEYHRPLDSWRGFARDISFSSPVHSHSHSLLTTVQTGRTSNVATSNTSPQWQHDVKTCGLIICLLEHIYCTLIVVAL